jgi:lauroyl/myristoyl acyltransferase
MQLVVYILVYPLLWLISRLPFKVIYFISDGVYVLLYHVIGYRKKVVRNNLALVFPEKIRRRTFTDRKKILQAHVRYLLGNDEDHGHEQKRNSRTFYRNQY